MLIDNAFRPMIELEKSLADLYSYWAGVFESDHEAAFVFSKLSGEENEHANRIEYQRRLVQRNKGLSTNVEIDLTTLQGTIDRIWDLRKASAPPSVTEAIAIALQLEASAAESHFGNALKQANPELERLLTTLGGDDRAHVARLQEFAEKRAISSRPPA